MIPVYNGLTYLEECLRSVLEQAPSADQMQITVLDDASTDGDVEALVRETSFGRVEYIRQPENLGMLGNYNACLLEARGHLVHLLHADDRVLSGYYETVGGLLRQYPDAAAAFVRQRYIDESGRVFDIPAPEEDHEGILEGWLERIAIELRHQYVAIAFRRSAFESVGGFFGVTYGEDWEMSVRIASKYPIAYSPRPLADYRMHPHSMTHKNLLSGQSIADTEWVRQTIQTYLPPSIKLRVWKLSAAKQAYHGVASANTLWRVHGDKAAATRQLREAFRLNATPRVFWGACKLRGKMALKLRW